MTTTRISYYSPAVLGSPRRPACQQSEQASGSSSELLGRITGAEPAVDGGARTITAPTTGGVEAIIEIAASMADARVALEDLSLRQPNLD